MTNARLAAYGVLGMPLAMAALPIYVHVPKFYSEHVGLSLASVGGLLLAARALDAVQDPLLGWWSDRRRASSGHRWAFVGWGAALLALGMVGLFNPPAGSDALRAGWLLANLVVVYTAYSLATVSYQAHGAEITADRAQRTRVTAWREGFGLAGVMLAAVLPGLLAGGGGEPAGLARFAALFAPLVLGAALLAMIASPPALGEARRAPPPLARMALPLANPAFRWLGAVFLCGGIASAIPATLVLFYVQDVLRRPELAGAFLAAYFGAGAAGLPLWTGLARRIGKARAWIVGMVLAVLAFLWAFALGAGDSTPFLAICVLSGLALGADLALAPSLLADVIDRDEAAGHGRHEGAYFGLWSLATKASLALAAGIALPLLGALGYAPGRTQEAFALAAVYALVPCALKSAAAVLLWRSPLMKETHP